MAANPDMVRELASFIANAIPDAFAHPVGRNEQVAFELESDFSEEERRRFEQLAAAVITFMRERVSPG